MKESSKYTNTLIKECGDCPDILDGARAVLDFLSKVELSQNLTLSEESAKYWINRMVIDALEYVSTTGYNSKNMKPVEKVDWELIKEGIKCVNSARNKRMDAQPG